MVLFFFFTSIINCLIFILFCNLEIETLAHPVITALKDELEEQFTKVRLII